MNNFFIVFYLKFTGCIVITMPKKPKPTIKREARNQTNNSFSDIYKQNHVFIKT
ncbi:hypothetical protein N824_12015 [Pedobacter sp. V48]|nr:hypothetical protein N824_12015 [Pedobacter sp. V48]